MKTLSLFLIACGLSFAQNVATPVFICLSASASATVYTCTPSPLAAFPTGVPVSANWIPDVTNTTTTPTLNLGPGAKPLKDAAGNNLTIGAIVANAIYTVTIEGGGTNLRVLAGPIAPAGISSALACSKFVVTDEGTTSTTYVDLATLDSCTTASLVATTTVVIAYMGDSYSSAGTVVTCASIVNVDGSDVTGNDALQTNNLATQEQPAIAKHIASLSSGGTHTIKVRHKVFSGAAGNCHWLNRMLWVTQ
jgi:hypothetical protein